MEKNTSQPASAASPFNWFEALRPTRINPGPLAAIWLKDNVRLADGRITRRITEGDLVYIHDNGLMNCPEGQQATHMISNCMGTLYDNFSINVIDLKTREITNIPL